MTITLLTLFPNFFVSPFSMGVIDGAIKNASIDIDIVNLRDYGDGNYKKCDDYSYGGGPGLVMTASIFEKYFDKNKKGHTVFFTPTGSPLKQNMVKRLSNEDNITLILGHYEGIDKRVEELYVDECISIGDYVLSGGEIPSLVLIDAISRYKDVLGNELSVLSDTFEENASGLLEYDQYTRPPFIKNLSVPEVLLNGNHKCIDEYRRKSSLIKTFNYRPDLLTNIDLTKKDIKTIFNYLIEKSN